MSILKSDQPTGGTRSVAAFFATREAAVTAKTDVIATGVSAEAVKITDAHGTVTGNSAATPRESTGFIDSIKHAFAQDQPNDNDQRHRDGFVVTAHVSADAFDKVHEVLAREGTITDV